jgi:hypothetical protein
VTQEGKLIWCMDAKLSIKESFIGKSVRLQALKCYGHVNSEEEICLTEPTLTRKASSDVIG